MRYLSLLILCCWTVCADQFEWRGGSDPAVFAVVGDVSYHSDGARICSEYYGPPDREAGEMGAIWTVDKFNLRDMWRVEFLFELSVPLPEYVPHHPQLSWKTGGGFVFVLQDIGLQALGDGGDNKFGFYNIGSPAVGWDYDPWPWFRVGDIKYDGEGLWDTGARNGYVGTPFTNTPVRVTMLYTQRSGFYNNCLVVTLETDATTRVIYNQSLPVEVAQHFQDRMVHMGFTSSDGDTYPSTFQLKEFKFKSWDLPREPEYVPAEANNSVTISWFPSNYGIGYNLLWGENSRMDAPYTNKAVIDGRITNSFVVSNLEIGRPYYFALETRWHNSGLFEERSALSDEACIVLVESDRFAAPTNLRLKHVLSIVWDERPEAVGYKVFLYNGGEWGDNSLELDVGDVTEYALSDILLEDGEMYSVRVQAYDALGRDSEYSNNIWFIYNEEVLRQEFSASLVGVNRREDFLTLTFGVRGALLSNSPLLLEESENLMDWQTLGTTYLTEPNFLLEYETVIASKRFYRLLYEK